MSERMLYTVTDGIATITFNRPQVMNALDPETIVAFRAVCERAGNDPQARVVMLRGAGPAFLAGGDVASFRDMLPDGAGRVAALAEELHRGILALR